MNWINSVFYVASAFTGVCWIALKIRPLTYIMPRWILATMQWFAELFFVIITIFIIRSLIWEPFRIPSASMMPTLEAGDFILVNKYQYGSRLPGLPFKLLEGEPPKRGDIIVFRYPLNKTQDYIKRLIAIPGDTIEYMGTRVWDEEQKEWHIKKELRVNGERINTDLFTGKHSTPENNKPYISLYHENLFGATYMIRENKGEPVIKGYTQSLEAADVCQYTLPISFRCQIPEGRYFVMGDNRDESADSRYWGFVTEDYIIGRAFFIWMHFGKWDRIGSIR